MFKGGGRGECNGIGFLEEIEWEVYGVGLVMIYSYKILLEIN